MSNNESIKNMLSSKEALEKLLNDINEQGQVITTNPNLIVNFNVNLEMFTTTIENALKDLERLEVLEKLVYTNQLENTKDIENEFGRAFTILQNHCVAMEDTLYASKVLIQLISKYEKLKKAIEDEIELLVERRFTAYACDDYKTHNVLNTIIEELRELLSE